MDRPHALERATDDPDALVSLEHVPATLRGSFGQSNEAADDHRLQSFHFMVRATSGAVSHTHQAEHAESVIDRPPLLDDAYEEIAVEQRRGCSLRLDHRQEGLVAAQAELFGGEAL